MPPHARRAKRDIIKLPEKALRRRSRRAGAIAGLHQ
jgi:uncharacterized protein YjeT (DUF2065 family)